MFSHGWLLSNQFCKMFQIVIVEVSAVCAAWWHLPELSQQSNRSWNWLNGHQGLLTYRCAISSSLGIIWKTKSSRHRLRMWLIFVMELLGAVDALQGSEGVVGAFCDVRRRAEVCVHQERRHVEGHDLHDDTSYSRLEEYLAPYWIWVSFLAHTIYTRPIFFFFFFFLGGLLFTSHWLNLQHWAGFLYIAVYGDFRDSWFSRALFCILGDFPPAICMYNTC